MRCLVINLDRSPERLIHIGSQFSTFGLNFERVAAVDGRELDDAVLAMQPVSKQWKRMNKAEIACFMSHRKCWAIIAEGSDAYGAVIEDDVFFSPSATHALSSSDWIPAEVGLLKIETFRQKVFLSRARVLADAGRTIHALRGCHVGTGGYVISRDYAKRLLELSEGCFHALSIISCSTMRCRGRTTAAFISSIRPSASRACFSTVPTRRMEARSASRPEQRLA
ncbi:glycosyltransferase family 25 protein [Ensifer adhaerens]|uniref:glycosyltransferase family 25 protein n=1 Tax=Ensifer adhaerens TaxID=106592 RepID=UPI003CED34D5